MDVPFRERPPEVDWASIIEAWFLFFLEKSVQKLIIYSNSYLKRENDRTDEIQKHFAIAWFKGVSFSALFKETYDTLFSLHR